MSEYNQERQAQQTNVLDSAENESAKHSTKTHRPNGGNVVVKVNGMHSYPTSTGFSRRKCHLSYYKEKRRGKNTHKSLLETRIGYRNFSSAIYSCFHIQLHSYCHQHPRYAWYIHEDDLSWYRSDAGAAETFPKTKGGSW